jgi:ribosomal protein S18 acetylase RimI-like enzyme
VRRADYRDAEAAARCMSRVFRAEEAARDGGWVDPVTRRLVRWAGWLDMVAQLSRRLEATREGGGRGAAVGEAALPHALLVAEDVDAAPGEVVGCIELGVVNVPRLLANGMQDEIGQWGRPAARPAAGAGAGAPVDRAETNVDLPYIGNLAVAPVFRRRGVASRLVAEAEAVGASWGYSAVCLHVDADSAAAVRLYAGLGYVCSAREPRWHRRVGRVRRLFLRKDVAGWRGDPVDAGEWEADGVAVVSRKMSFVEYLRYCLTDVGGRRAAGEGER